MKAQWLSHSSLWIKTISKKFTSPCNEHPSTLHFRLEKVGWAIFWFLSPHRGIMDSLAGELTLSKWFRLMSTIVYSKKKGYAIWCRFFHLRVDPIFNGAQCTGKQTESHWSCFPVNFAKNIPYVLVPFKAGGNRRKMKNNICRIVVSFSYKRDFLIIHLLAISLMFNFNLVSFSIVYLISFYRGFIV